MDELLLTTDPDYAAYNSGDPEFLLRSVGATIRNYCGWHLSPSIAVTLTGLPVGSDGILMLPSLFVTDVASVTMQGGPESDPVELDADTYVWYEGGWIEPVRSESWRYFQGSRGMPPMLATVTFTHGYASLPADIKRVAYELAGWASGLGADGSGGDVKIIRSPGFELALGGKVALGMNLNPDQKARLANYTIGRVK